MTAVTAQLVAKLREMTGFGMMECKKALIEAKGELQKAQDLLRIKSGAKAGKVASRVAKEGMIGSYLSEDKKLGAIVEVNCETDFVAKDQGFVAYANLVAKTLAKASSLEGQEVGNLKAFEGQESLEELRHQLVAKLGENITIRRVKVIKSKGDLALYLHGKKIGVLVSILGGNPTLNQDIALHIAASKPLSLSQGEIDPEVLAREKNIYTEIASQSGKNPEIVAKMVEGKLSKFLAEVTLLGQNFVKNPEVSVEQLLKQHNAKVEDFGLFVVGEGIEKEETDFRAEVAKMSKSSQANQA